MDARQLLKLAPALFRAPLEALLDRLESTERQVDQVKRELAELRASMSRNS